MVYRSPDHARGSPAPRFFTRGRRRLFPEGYSSYFVAARGAGSYLPGVTIEQIRLMKAQGFDEFVELPDPGIECEAGFSGAVFDPDAAAKSGAFDVIHLIPIMDSLAPIPGSDDDPAFADGPAPVRPEEQGESQERHAGKYEDGRPAVFLYQNLHEGQFPDTG